MTEATRTWRERALGPLFSLEPEEVRAKRLRALAILPFLVVVGFATALAMARDRGVPLLAGWAGAVLGYGLLVFLGSVLETLGRALVEALHAPLANALVTVGADALTGAAIGLALGSQHDSVYGAVALCAGLLPLYNLVVAQVVFGGAVEWAWQSLLAGGPAAPPQYSRADALAARGLYDDAVSAVLSECRKPDAATFARIGRMLREGRRFEAAVEWLRRALAQSPDAALETQLVRELCELYTHRLEQPERCAPVLARLAATRAGTAAGEWAAAELREVKRRMERTEGDVSA